MPVDMPVEMEMLLLAALLLFVQIAVFAVAAVSQVGLFGLAGNREGLPAYSGWAGRAERAYKNTIESLVIFAIGVLVARELNLFNEVTALGANLYVGGRVAHWLIYLAGIPWLRTLAWAASIAGIALIYLQFI